jgi:hypothetical protein
MMTLFIIKYSGRMDTLAGTNMFKWGKKFYRGAYFNAHLLKNSGFKGKAPGKIRPRQKVHGVGQ